ncbi:MAG TPA: hypothetical protein VF649_06650 [Sphingomonas sp.]|jgi:hypothetical protein|uniref:hypothetical protein n=1 Tax=Sphingomonas sp. TaxID=28214 RepID=UPI002ED980CA
MVTTYKVSKSGFYKVGLARVFPHAGFDYKPGHDHTVNQDILDAMIAAELVTDVAPA